MQSEEQDCRNGKRAEQLSGGAEAAVLTLRQLPSAFELFHEFSESPPAHEVKYRLKKQYKLQQSQGYIVPCAEIQLKLTSIYESKAP